MKNKKIENSIVAVSLVVVMSVSTINIMKDKKQEKLEKEEKIQYQIMLNENSPSIEDYEEIENLYEQEKKEWEEKIKYEVENNPNFEEDFNKLQEIERRYLEITTDIILTGDKTDAERRRREKKWLENEINKIKLEEESVLNELRSSMILYYKWDYCDSLSKMNDLEEIIRLYI